MEPLTVLGMELGSLGEVKPHGGMKPPATIHNWKLVCGRLVVETLLGT